MESVSKIEFAKRRDFGEVLNVTFQFLRQNFKSLGLALLYIAGPFILIQGIITGYYQIDTFNFQNTGFLDAYTFLYFLTTLSQMITYAVIISVVYEYIVLYLNNENETITVNMVWEQSQKSIIPTIVMMIGIGLLIGLGFILLIIPGIYFMVVISLFWIVIFKEGVSFSTAVSRCITLIKNNWWKTLGLIIIGFILQYAVSFIFALPTVIIVILKMLSGFENAVVSNVPDILTIIFAIIAAFAELFYAISLVILAFQYFNLVEGKDAEGLLTKIDNIS